MPSLSLRNGSSVSSFAHNFLVSSLATLLRGTVYNYKARYLNFVSIAVIKCPDFLKKIGWERGLFWFTSLEGSPGGSPGRKLIKLVTYISTVKSRRKGFIHVCLHAYFHLDFSIFVQFQAIFLGNGTIAEGWLFTPKLTQLKQFSHRCTHGPTQCDQSASDNFFLSNCRSSQVDN